jgi:hypothetical protein
MSLPGRHPLGGRDLNPPCGSKSSENFHERRTVMMNLALIDAMYHEAIFIFMMIAVIGIMIAVIGISMEMVLRR